MSTVVGVGVDVVHRLLDHVSLGNGLGIAATDDLGVGAGNGISGEAGSTLHVHFPRQNFVFNNINAILFVKYYAVASVSVLYFDYLLTLPTEIRRIWSPVFRAHGSGFTGATLLFVLNRYVPLFGYVPVMVSLFNPPWSIESCARFAPYVGAINASGQFVIAVILVLRTFALYGRNVWILLLTGSAGTVCVGVAAWGASAVQGNLFNFKPFVVCVPILSISADARLQFAWIATFLFDFLIFLLTIARTYALTRAQSNIMHSSIVMLVMRDGSVYFLVMSIVNAINYVLFLHTNLSFFASATGTTSIMAHIISVTMMSHLLLNLRQDHARSSRDARVSSTQPTSGICRFRNLAFGGFGGRGGGSGTTFFTSRIETGTNLVFTTRIFGNLTTEYREEGSWEEEEWKEVRGYRRNANGVWRRRGRGSEGSEDGDVESTGTGTGTGTGDDTEEMEMQDRVRTRDRIRSKSPTPGSSRGSTPGGGYESERERDRWRRKSGDPKSQQQNAHAFDESNYDDHLRSRRLQVHPVGDSRSQSHSPQSLLSPSSTLVPATPVSTVGLGEPIITHERERFLRSQMEEGVK